MRWATPHSAPGTSCDWTAPNHAATPSGEAQPGPTRRLFQSLACAIARFVTGPSLGRELTRTRHDRAADDYDGAVSREPVGWDVDSPVQAEVFVVWLDGDRLQLTGPDGPQPWILQLGAEEHPVEVVDRIVRDVVGPPILVHSTSWRR